MQPNLVKSHLEHSHAIAGNLLFRSYLFVLFEAWWNSGFAFSVLLAGKPNFCAEKHAKWISLWSVGKSYCGCFCFYGLMLFAILLPNDKMVQVAISDGWHLLGFVPRDAFGPFATSGEFQGHPNPGQKWHRKILSGKAVVHHKNTRLLRDVWIPRQFTVWN